MANAIYPKFKEALLQSSGSNLSSGAVKAILIDLADYTYNSSHDFLDDVPAAARVAITAALGSKTFVNGVFDHADDVWSAVTGDQSEAVVYFIDTGVEATSRLICYFDSGVTGLPVTPTGGSINLNVNASGVFAL